MTWLALALATGGLVALRDALVKLGGAASDEYATIFGLSVVSALLLGAVLLVIGVPDVGPGFGRAVLGSALPNVAAYLLLARAVRLNDLSLVAPLLGLTPLFLLFTTPLILGERPTPLGIAGVLLIVAGAWLLKVGDARDGVFGPFRALMREPGARSMLAVAFIWSVSANYDKIGVAATSPIAWPVVVHVVVALALAPIVLVRARGGGRSRLGWSRDLVLAGVVNALQAAAHMTALTLTLVPYVIAVKRTSLLFSVALGRLMFGEGGIRERALGAAVIFAGVVLFVLS